MSETASSTPTRRARRSRSVLLVAAVLVAASDLAAKALAERRLTDASVDLGLLQLRLAYNNGVAFSLGNALPWEVVVAVTAVITVAMALYGWRRAPAANSLQVLAGGAVLGGTVANVVDRAGDGVVTDYLHTGWWPTFNLADTFLVLGIGVLVLGQLYADRSRTRPTADDPTAEERIPRQGSPGDRPR